jgi:phospholipase A2
MSNNLPLYPLLRKGRDVDIIVCFDASADIKQENWLSAADGYAKQRGIKGWPVGAGWPKEKDDTKKELDAADAATAQEAAGKIADAREEQREKSQNETQKAIDKGRNQNQNDSDLSYCNVWVGTTMEREGDTEHPQSKRVDQDADWQLLAPDAGITVVYFPFLPNPKVEGVDPNTSPYLSTWNFIYTPEEIDKVVSLARANFEAGKDQTKRTVRAVYERKKTRRLEAEEKDKWRRWRNNWREHGDHFQ